MKPFELAGAVASVIFVTAQAPMLGRVLKTRDMRIYSGFHLALGTADNAIWWDHLLANVPDPTVRYLYP